MAEHPFTSAVVCLLRDPASDWKMRAIRGFPARMPWQQALGLLIFFCGMLCILHWDQVGVFWSAQLSVIVGPVPCPAFASDFQQCSLRDWLKVLVLSSPPRMEKCSEKLKHVCSPKCCYCTGVCWGCREQMRVTDFSSRQLFGISSRCSSSTLLAYKQCVCLVGRIPYVSCLWPPGSELCSLHFQSPCKMAKLKEKSYISSSSRLCRQPTDRCKGDTAVFKKVW